MRNHKYVNQLVYRLAYTVIAVIVMLSSIGSGSAALFASTAAADGSNPAACTADTAPTDSTFPAAPTPITPYNTASYRLKQPFSFAWDPITSDTGSISYEWESSSSPTLNPDGSFLNQVGHQIITSTSIADGNSSADTYYWHVRAILNNTTDGSWSDTYVVTVSDATPSDTTAPNASIITPATNAIVGDPIRIILGVSDTTVTACRITITASDGTKVVNKSNSILTDPSDGTIYYDWNTRNFDGSTIVADGSYTITVDAYDVNGNHGTTSEQVTLDNTNPAVSITSPAANSTVSGTLDIIGSISDLHLASYTVTICNTDGVSGCMEITVPNANTIQNGSLASFDTTQLPDGTYRILVNASDTVNNQGIDFRTVIIDNTTPTTPGLGGGTGSEGSGTPTNPVSTQTTPKLSTIAAITKANNVFANNYPAASSVLGSTTQTSTPATSTAAPKHDTTKPASVKNTCSKWFGMCWYWTVAAALVLIGAIYTYIRAADRNETTAGGR